MGKMVDSDTVFQMVIIFTLVAAALSWLATRSYCCEKLSQMKDVLDEFVAENAKLRVAMAAAKLTGEAKKVCDLTLAALNAAYPGSPEQRKEDNAKLKEGKNEAVLSPLPQASQGPAGNGRQACAVPALPQDDGVAR